MHLVKPVKNMLIQWSKRLDKGGVKLLFWEQITIRDLIITIIRTIAAYALMLARYPPRVS